MELKEALADAVRRDSVRVPPYPSTAMKLQQVMAKPDYSTAGLVEAMRTDAVFTGNILRLANSPFYRRGDPVTSLAVAVSRIGARELTRLALAATVSSAAASAGPLAELRRGQWRRSLTAALVCEALARVDSSDPSEAFVAGLLHDAGALLAIGCLEDVLTKHGLQATPAAIDALVEEQHVTLGLLLSARWQLPPSLQHVIAHHHDAEVVDGLTRKVAVADRIVAAMERQASLDANALVGLSGLSLAACEALAQQLPRIPGTITAFEAEAEERAKTPESPLLVDASDTAVATPLRAGRRRTSFLVEIKGQMAEVRSADAEGFSALVKQPLAANALVEVRAPAGLVVWAVVQRCRKLGDVHEAECSLFAVSGTLAAQWQAHVERQQAA